jgi:hypothetical protein
MQNKVLRKGLAASIIALIIGLAFIPSFNAVSISMLDNHPPYVPSNPYPDGPPVDIDVILSWDGGDPDPEDTVTYDIYFGSYNPPPYEATIGPYPANQTRIEYDPGELIYYKKYYWHVVVIDNYGLQTEGPIWSFTTKEDDTPTPIIEVTWETYKLNGTWYVDFNCSFYDNGSGIKRVVWYLNGKEMDVIVGPGPVYEFHFTVKLSIAKKSVFRFEAYYGDGLSSFVEVDGSDIKSDGDCGCSDDFSNIDEIKENSIIFDELKINIPAEKQERFICVYLVTIRNAWIGVSIACGGLAIICELYNYNKLAGKLENITEIANSKVDYYESLLDKYDC